MYVNQIKKEKEQTWFCDFWPTADMHFNIQHSITTTYRAVIFSWHF